MRRSKAFIRDWIRSKTNHIPQTLLVTPVVVFLHKNPVLFLAKYTNLS